MTIRETIRAFIYGPNSTQLSEPVPVLVDPDAIPNGTRKVTKGTAPAPALTVNSQTSMTGVGKSTSPVNNPRVRPPLAGGRQTLPTNFNPVGMTGYNFLYRREYQDLDLSNIEIGDYEAIELLQLLADLNPDVSRALWNTLRVAGTQIKFQAVNADESDDIVGQSMVDNILKRINTQAGGLANVIRQMLMSAYLMGAVALDVAPTGDLTDVEDFFPVNPVTIYFMRDDNQVPVPFQRQPVFWGTLIAPFRRLNTDLFFYTPIDPFIDDVYGRPPAAPSLQVVFFQIQVLQDLRRVIHAQGWPKIDISVITEILKQHMPPDTKQDDQAFQDWISDRLGEIIAAYNSMEPEDAYIHPDYIEISSDSAKAGQSLFNVEGLLRVIRSQLISALKQLPILMGENASSTETFSTVELAIFSQSIEIFREPVGEILAKALEISLQLQGHVGIVKAIWPPIQILSRMAISLADAQDAANQVYFRDQGFIDQDTASKAVTGSKAVTQEIPLYNMVPMKPAPGATQSPVGSNGPVPAHIKNANQSIH